MRILSVAFPFAALTCDAAGGAEQVLAALDRALTTAGHQSVVIARAGSRVTGELIEIPAPEGPITDEVRSVTWDAVRRAIECVIAGRTGAVADLIHFHGIDCAEYLEPAAASGIPVLVTLHLPPSWYPASLFADPRISLHCVSESQRRACPESAGPIPVIPNGVELRDYRPRRQKRNYLLMLARICPEKGIHHALEVAERCGRALLIAGEVHPWPSHQQYFREQIVPRLDGHLRRFLGPVGGGRKRRLLAGASALLIPSEAPETSSLVAMEAAASGTPVIAFRSGALPEVVQDGETGFLVSDVREMADAVARVGSIDPDVCRATAERRFDVRRSEAAYLRLYEYSPEVLTAADQLRALKSEWTGLFERCPGATPFQHPGWQLAWWEAFGTAELNVIALRRRSTGELAAIAPCYRWDGRLVFIGNGITDQQDLIAASPDAAQALLDVLAGERLDLQEIRGPSALLDRFPHERCSVSPVVDLAAPVPKNARRNIQKARAKLEGRQVRWIHTPEAEVPGLLGELFRLHEARWRSAGESGVLADAQTQAFHRAVADEFARAGLLRLHALEVDGAVIGVVYAFARAGTTHSYLGGLDPAWAHTSPGALSIWAAMEYARSAGDRWYDFLRGQEAYKYLWGACDREQYRIYTH